VSVKVRPAAMPDKQSRGQYHKSWYQANKERIKARQQTRREQKALPVNDGLNDIQRAYGASCVEYEQKANQLLQKSDALVISGYGCALRVKNDALIVFPGKTHKDQTQTTVTLHRGVHTIKHIILLSDKGLVTLDAIKWSGEQGITIMMVDGHGHLLQSLPPDNESDAKLRQAQYRAIDTGLDVHITREIIRMKTEQQIMTLKALPSHPLIDGPYVIVDGRKATIKVTGELDYGDFIWQPFEEALVTLPYVNDVNAIELIEARLAITYWYYFLGIPLNWKESDKKKIPLHWLYCTQRISPFSGNKNAQRAINPFHAVLNYAYAILAGQCRQALISQGFDAAKGFLHAPVLHRDSLVFDLMECHRPQVDRLALTFFRNTKLAKGDFMSTKDGTVKFNPQFSRFIAASCRIPQADIESSVSWLKGLLIGSW